MSISPETLSMPKYIETAAGHDVSGQGRDRT